MYKELKEKLRKDFYVKYGFNVREEGIGWVIKLK